MQEIKLENGRICLNGLGLPKMVSGLEALLQQAYNRLNIVRGSFRYDRDLGSRIPQMELSDELAAETALRFAQEALLPCPEITAEYAVPGDNIVTVMLSTPLGSGSVTVYLRGENDDV